MKLIKNLVNLMFLYCVPFILLGLFCLLTAFSFKYSNAVTSNVWIVVITLYSITVTILYGVSLDEEDELSIWK